MSRASAPRWANVWGFLAATFAAAWLIWLVAIALSDEEPILVLVGLGAFVPSAMGILFTFLTQDRRGWRDFWLRVIDVRRIGWRWLFVIALIFPAAHVIAIAVLSLLGGTPPTLAGVRTALLSPGIMLQLILANLIISGLSEELGWRGFALDPLQRRYGALWASLLLGAAHGLWHLPLFFIPGIAQGEMGLLSVGSLLFFAMALALTPLFTWIYNNTNRSILSAVLVHFTANTSFNVLVGLRAGLPEVYTAVYLGVLIAFDTLIVVIWGAKTMGGRQKTPRSRAFPVA